MAWSWNRKSLAVAICGVAATVLFGVAAWIYDASDEPAAGTTQTQTGGSGNTQIENNGVINNNAQEFAEGSKGQSREEILQAAEKYKGVPPPPGGVAPYLVVASGNLFVRDSPKSDGKQIGAAWHNTLVYAGCSVESDFDPILDDEMKGEWVKVRWPTLKPSRDMLVGQPSDPLQGWVYRGRIVPAGHNGNLPSC